MGFRPSDGSSDNRLARVEGWAESHAAVSDERWDVQFRTREDVEERLRSVERSLTEERVRLILLSAIGSVIGSSIVGAIIVVVMSRLMGGAT